MTTAAVRANFGLCIVALGASIAPLDFAVNVAFPAITAAFALEVQAIRWVVICYVVTYASLMLAFGKLGDVAGHRRVFRAGLMAAAAAFAACALAPTYAWLLAARVVQGIAIALVLSCAPALVVSFFAETRRTWALSRYAMVTALAGIAGPLIGGASIDWLNWPGVFWFRLPVALLTLLLLRNWPAAAVVDVPPRYLDVVSSMLLSAGLALLLAALALWPDASHGAWPLAAGIVAGLLLMVFARRERRSAEPILPRAALRDPVVMGANFASVMVNFTGFATPLLVPYYLARIGGYGAAAMGVLLAMASLGVLAGSAAAPRFVRALGQHRAAQLGVVLVAAAQLVMAAWPRTPTASVLVAALLLHGLGIGLFQVSYTDWIVAALPRTDRGVAGSLTMLTRTIGVVVAAVVLSAALQAAEARHLAAGRTAVDAFHAAFSMVFWYSGLMLAGLLVLGSALPARWRRNNMGNPPA
jgi:MFS family permease